MNTLAVWLVCEFTRCVVGLSAGWLMWSWCDNCNVTAMNELAKEGRCVQALFPLWVLYTLNV